VGLFESTNLIKVYKWKDVLKIVEERNMQCGKQAEHICYLKDDRISMKRFDNKSLYTTFLTLTRRDSCCNKGTISIGGENGKRYSQDLP
jgi:hypothetical protein